MSVRHFEALFQPGSVALIGASDRAGSLGAVVLRKLEHAGDAVRCGRNLGPCPALALRLSLR